MVLLVLGASIVAIAKQLDKRLELIFLLETRATVQAVPILGHNA